MKFTKPINREVDIDGHHFIVSFDDLGIEFRLKGKRKTARATWPQVLDIARGEDGEDARALLGLGASIPDTGPDTGPDADADAGQTPSYQAQHENDLARTINPPAPQSQPDGSAQAPPSTASSLPHPPSPETQSPSGETTDRDDEQGRAVTAGDIGPES